MTSRYASVAVVALLAACGGTSALPHGVPAVTLPDSGAHVGLVDAGPVPDAGPPDAGEWFITACGDAGCSDLDHCQPFPDAGVACGPLCGDPCSDARCTDGACNDVGGMGWAPAVCTNVPAPAHWSQDPTCDDGNPCTISDVCYHGSCVASAAPTSQSCDDNNVCTTGDHCDGNGGCAGTAVNDPVDRFFNSSAATYAYAAPGGWSFSGWVDDGVIFSSVPANASGAQDLYLLFDRTAVDRILALSATSGSYGGGTVVGRVLTTHAAGTVPLLAASYTCGNVSGSCSTVGGSSAARHYFYTSGHGSPPAGSGSNSGMYVCPP